MATRQGRDIGAAALGFYFDMRWRRTADVDLVVALELEDFPGALLDRPGWQQHPGKEHAFISPTGAKIDLLPAGPALLDAGSIAWASGQVMSLAAMDLAFAHAEPHALSDYRTALVAPPPVLAILKMVSYADRPFERERDLQDLAYLLGEYVDDDSDRRFDEAVGYDFELAPAYLFGLDVGRTARVAAHRALVERFLTRVGDPDGVEHAVMRNLGPSYWRDEDALQRALGAFRNGLAMSPVAGTGGER